MCDLWTARTVLGAQSRRSFRRGEGGLTGLFDRVTASGCERFSRDVASIHFDWSKTHLDEEALGAFAALAYVADYHGAPRLLVRRRNRQCDRGPARHPCCGARAGQARGQPPRRRAPRADAEPGRCDRGRRVRRDRFDPAHRHRRFGAWSRPR